MSRELELIDGLLRIQRSAIQFRWGLAAIVLLIGIALIVTGNLPTSSGDQAKWVLQLGGGLVASLAGFPVPEVFARKTRIMALLHLQAEFSRPAIETTSELERLREKLWQLLDALGR